MFHNMVCRENISMVSLNLTILPLFKLFFFQSIHQLILIIMPFVYPYKNIIYIKKIINFIFVVILRFFY